jgi:hypothetical protein
VGMLVRRGSTGGDAELHLQWSFQGMQLDGEVLPELSLVMFISMIQTIVALLSKHFSDSVAWSRRQEGRGGWRGVV